MPVPMLDLKAQYERLKDEIDAAVKEVFAAQQFRGGPVVEAFESEIALYAHVPYALGVASGTDALLLLLRAIDLQPGEEVITTPFTFFATAGAIANAGGVPVFSDIDPATFNLDPGGIEEKITEKTRAIMPVHLYGQCADMDAIRNIAERHNLAVLEDAAQALGARYHDQPAGSLGHGAAVSFYPTKNLGAAGEGGMILTGDTEIAEKVRMLRAHGSGSTYIHMMIGANSHLHTLQAAVLRVKLKHLDAWNLQRRAHAAYYNEKFADLEEIRAPREVEGNYHVYHQYVIRIPRRDEARNLLQERGIGCGVFYPLPLHRQECFAHLGCAGTACPVADQAAEEVLALPVYPELTAAQLDEVAGAIRDHIRGR
jgi:dTDP-4-amino-4,6-dideoxygalactose transaminase